MNELESIARRLCEGEVPDGARVLKQSRVRVVARVPQTDADGREGGDVLLKVFRRPGRAPAREAAALAEASRRGVRAPELVGHGPDWIATRWIDARAATRDDLPALLEGVGHLHAAGMLHGDLHLGNLLVDAAGLIVTDLQRSRFWPWIPGPLRRRELGWLAFSLGEPLPPELAQARRWRDLRAQRHWRSRTRRCVMESTDFTRFDHRGAAGFRRREVDTDRLSRELDGLDRAEPFKARPSANLFRVSSDGQGPDWIVKQHASPRAARRAWVSGRGLEARGIGTGRALAWSGCWLVMEDAGVTLIDWVESSFAQAGHAVADEMADALGGLLAALHRRGIYHADLKANNVVWRPGETPRLLDYGRVRFSRRVGRRRRAKNLAQLNAALPDVVPAATRERAFGRYADEVGADDVRSALRDRVIELSLRRRHRWTGC